MTVTGTDHGGLSVSQSFSVTVDGVEIGTVEPAVLLEGEEATIHGRGFATSIANNLILVDGIPAPVTAATATQLTIRVPRSDCLPPRKAELDVTVLGLSDALQVSVTPTDRERMDLDPGWYRWTYAGNGCLLLPGDSTGGEWLIGVVSTARDPSVLSPITVSGIPGDLDVFANLGTAAAASRTESVDRAAREGVAFAGPIPDGFAPGTAGAGADRGAGSDPHQPPSRRDWEAHNEFMERSEELLRTLGPVTPVASPAAADGRSYSTGDTVTLFGGCLGNCSERDTVRAVVRLSGANSIWLEDLANPPGGLTASELTTLDEFYVAREAGA
ncbi:IPT/TIG domain-containing protein [Candidatus Palauibacter irciniicola]|uniref:IPT/TIG domain-containing protein n=1 Tax=Candidatus Palauibacter irciniicola TaxID=3056733 RepID=UPI003B01C428